MYQRGCSLLGIQVTVTDEAEVAFSSPDLAWGAQPIIGRARSGGPIASDPPAGALITTHVSSLWRRGPLFFLRVVLFLLFFVVFALLGLLALTLRLLAFGLGWLRQDGRFRLGLRSRLFSCLALFSLRTCQLGCLLGSSGFTLALDVSASVCESFRVLLGVVDVKIFEFSHGLPRILAAGRLSGVAVVGKSSDGDVAGLYGRALAGARLFFAQRRLSKSSGQCGGVRGCTSLVIGLHHGVCRLGKDAMMMRMSVFTSPDGGRLCMADRSDMFAYK